MPAAGSAKANAGAVADGNDGFGKVPAESLPISNTLFKRLTVESSIPKGCVEDSCPFEESDGELCGFRHP